MHFRLAGEEDRQTYEAFLRDHPLADYPQGWAWGVFKAKGPWKVYRALVEDGPNCVGVATILSRRIPLPWPKLRFLYVPRGPVIDPKREPEAFETFLQGMQDLAKKERAIVLKVDPPILEDDEAVTCLRQAGFLKGRRRGKFGGVQPRFVACLALDAEPEALHSRFQGKCRYNIRLAERRGVKVRQVGLEELPTFLRLLRETAQRDGFQMREDAFFEELFQVHERESRARLWLAEHEGKAIAGAYVLMTGRRATYLFGASSNEDRERMPNYLLQWHCIRQAVLDGCTLYDFLGIGKPGDPRSKELEGLWIFKRKFGAKALAYAGELDRPYSLPMYVLWRVAEPIYFKGMVAAARLKKWATARQLRPQTGEA